MSGNSGIFCGRDSNRGQMTVFRDKTGPDKAKTGRVLLPSSLGIHRTIVGDQDVRTSLGI